MEKTKFQVISCEGFDIAVTCETTDGDEYPIYYPANCLIYVEHGHLTLQINNKTYTIKEEEFVLVRKYTLGKYIKSACGNPNGFRDHIFVLNDTFIKEVIHSFEIPEDFLPCTVPIVQFANAPVLKGLMKSIEVYISGQIQIDRDLIQLKTKEALYALTSLKPELIHVFNEFSEKSRADLMTFMLHNYMHNMPLERFAQMSGRSLSSFNREFRQLFKMTPHKWMKQQRLELARKLLTQTKKTAVDVYLEVGFEDLAHFSRSFKSYFGYNPSELKFSR